MKIEIDTNRDSKEEIKKVIRMLTHLVGDSAAFGVAADSYSESNNSSPTSSYSEMPAMSMFDSDSPTGPSTTSTAKDEEDEEFDFSNLMTY